VEEQETKAKINQGRPSSFVLRAEGKKIKGKQAADRKDHSL